MGRRRIEKEENDDEEEEEEEEKEEDEDEENKVLVNGVKMKVKEEKTEKVDVEISNERLRLVAFERILDRLCAADVNDFFKEPVTNEIAPDYSSIVKYPMDLGTLRTWFTHLVLTSLKNMTLILHKKVIIKSLENQTKHRYTSTGHWKIAPLEMFCGRICKIGSSYFRQCKTLQSSREYSLQHSLSHGKTCRVLVEESSSSTCSLK